MRRRTPLRRSVRLRAKPKPASETRRIAAVRRAVFDRQGGRCACCPRTATDLHEVVFRSQCGAVSEANSVALCRRCHTDVHARFLTLSWFSDHTLHAIWRRPDATR